MCFRTQKHSTCKYVGVFEHKNECTCLRGRNNNNSCVYLQKMCTCVSAKLLHNRIIQFFLQDHVCAKKLYVCGVFFHTLYPDALRNNVTLSQSLGGAANKKCNQLFFLTNPNDSKMENQIFSLGAFVCLQLSERASAREKQD